MASGIFDKRTPARVVNRALNYKTTGLKRHHAVYKLSRCVTGKAPMRLSRAKLHASNLSRFEA